MQLFDRISPRRTFEEIATRIRRSFVDGTLKRGDKLPPDEELAAHLGVSRGALRGALRALEVAGVVELRTGRHGGSYISGGKPKVLSDNMVDLLHLQGLTIEQLTEARIWIEDIVVRAACTRATEADLAALDANIERAKALFDQGRLLEKAVANIEFHDVLAQATQNPLLVIVMHALTDVMTAFVQVNGGDTSRSTFASRTRFMAAMRVRDVDAALEEMRSNLRRVNSIYVRLARQHRNAPAAAPAPRAAVARPVPPAAPTRKPAHRFKAIDKPARKTVARAAKPARPGKPAELAKPAKKAPARKR